MHTSTPAKLTQSIVRLITRATAIETHLVSLMLCVCLIHTLWQNNHVMHWCNSMCA